MTDVGTPNASPGDPQPSGAAVGPAASAGSGGGSPPNTKVQLALRFLGGVCIAIAVMLFIRLALGNLKVGNSQASLGFALSGGLLMAVGFGLLFDAPSSLDVDIKKGDALKVVAHIGGPAVLFAFFVGIVYFLWPAPYIFIPFGNVQPNSFRANDLEARSDETKQLYIVPDEFGNPKGVMLGLAETHNVIHLKVLVKDTTLNNEFSINPFWPRSIDLDFGGTK